MSIRHAVLALLRDEPKYGMQLRDEFEQRTGEVWPLNVGQVYQTLQRLERDGLVASDGEGDGPQKRFAITEDGTTELDQWLRNPSELGHPPRDELLIKVLVVCELPGVDVVELIQVHRRSLVEAMQRYTAIKVEASPDDLPLQVVVDAELFRLEAAVGWLDATESRLRGAPTSPGQRGPSPTPDARPRLEEVTP